MIVIATNGTSQFTIHLDADSSRDFHGTSQDEIWKHTSVALKRGACLSFLVEA